MKPDYFASGAEVKELLAAQRAGVSVTGAGVATSNYQGMLMASMSAGLASVDAQAELIPAQTATSTVTGAAKATAGFSGPIRVVLDAALASAGTSPTLDVTLETSANGTTGWAAVGAAFTQVTDAVGAGQQEQIIDASLSLGYIRAKGTIGGTNTPTFEFSVIAVGQKVATGTPTIDIAIETSANNSTNWTNLANFTQVTKAAGDGPQRIAIEAGRSLGYIRAKATIVGTSVEAFPLAVMLTALKHY